MPASRLGLLLIALVVGCSILDAPPELFVQDDKQLPPIPPPRDAVRLQVILIERPMNDPLLGSALWQEVARIASMPSEVRNQLSDNGFRVGHVGSNPPHALQTLLGLSSEIDDDPSRRSQKQLSAQEIFLRSGGETEAQTTPAHSPYYSHCEITLVSNDGKKTEEFQNVRTVFRVKAKRMQEGWAQLEFQPEIHHGFNKLRPIPVPGGLQTRTSQEIDRLFSKKFTVKLTLGEMAVIGTDGNDPASLGYHFFRGNIPDSPVQRLIVVRLAGMDRIEPVRSN